MSAEIEIIKVCGAAGYETETIKTDVDLKSIDDASTPRAEAPIEILDEGTAYSYESWLRFRLKVVPDNKLENFKIWSEGTDIEVGVIITINTDAVNTYSTPSDSESTEGTRDNFKNKGVGSKIDVAGELTGVGDKTDFMVFQLEAASNASPGDIEDTVNFSYDES